MARPSGWVSRHKLTAAAAGVILFAFGWWASDYPRGMVAAWVDHARGHYEIQVLGYPPEWAWNSEQTVPDGYGFEVKTVAGCVVNHPAPWRTAFRSTRLR